jgi:CubicO group peptidase (beta-lactamase class C family)
VSWAGGDGRRARTRDAGAEPEALGLDPGRLARIGTVLQREVEAGRIPGALIMVGRRGRLAHTEAVGWRDAERRDPMQADAIFRVYSMTKPLTSVGAMILFEEGRLDLDEPVARYLPALARSRVVEADGHGRTRLVDAARDVTVHDLLRHTSGIVGGVAGSEPASSLYRQAGILPYDHAPSAYAADCQDLVDAIAELPLAHQPGTVWEYGRSGDVLGRLLEVVADQPLDAFLEERLFRPLGMVDTSFHLRPGTADRAAQPLTETDVAQPPVIDLVRRPSFISGGSGALSTAADYFRFALMLLGRGELDGVRILGRRTVELMCCDHLGPLAGTGPDYIPGPGYGFGLGLAVRVASGPAFVPGSVGEVWWLGRAATSFVVDPDDGLVAVAMTQKYARARRYQALCKTLVMQSVVD